MDDINAPQGREEEADAPPEEMDTDTDTDDSEEEDEDEEALADGEDDEDEEDLLDFLFPNFGAGNGNNNAIPQQETRPGDFVLNAPHGATVTLNFTKNTVSLNRTTRKWPLTDLSLIMGDKIKLRVQTNAATPIEILPGPQEYAMLPPVIVPGTKYVRLRGDQTRWRIVHKE